VTGSRPLRSEGFEVAGRSATDPPVWVVLPRPPLPMFRVVEVVERDNHPEFCPCKIRSPREGGQRIKAKTIGALICGKSTKSLLLE
jgi:hypothetical protein